MDIKITQIISWIGIGPQIAKKHYLQGIENHFKKTVLNPVLSAAEKSCQDVSERTGKIEENTQVIACQELSKSLTGNDLHQMTPTGFEPVLQG